MGAFFFWDRNSFFFSGSHGSYFFFGGGGEGSKKQEMYGLGGFPPKNVHCLVSLCDGILVSRNKAVKVSQISFAGYSFCWMFFCVCIFMSL